MRGSIIKAINPEKNDYIYYYITVELLCFALNIYHRYFLLNVGKWKTLNQQVTYSYFFHISTGEK